MGVRMEELSAREGPGGCWDGGTKANGEKLGVTMDELKQEGEKLGVGMGGTKAIGRKVGCKDGRN